jgi:hypothetical protein
MALHVPPLLPSSALADGRPCHSCALPCIRLAPAPDYGWLATLPLASGRRPLSRAHLSPLKSPDSSTGARRPTGCSAPTWRPRAPSSYLRCSPLHACAGVSSTTLATHTGGTSSFERQPQLGRASMVARCLASQRRRPPAPTH